MPIISIYLLGEAVTKLIQLVKKRLELCDDGKKNSVYMLTYRFFSLYISIKA